MEATVAAFKPSGPSGRSLSQFLKHKVTESISTPPWMGCQSIAGLPPSIKFTSTHLYSWVERGTVRVKCLAQEPNTMSLARARTQTARSGVKRTNHEATALCSCNININIMWMVFFKTPGENQRFMKLTCRQAHLGEQASAWNWEVKL